MKHRFLLLLTINICCLILLLSGRYLLLIAQAGSTPTRTLLIEAVHYDGYSYRDADEAIAIRNLHEEIVDIGGWSLSDNNNSESEIPAGILIQPQELAWFTNDANAFQREFGFQPDVVLADWPGFANDGDEVLLLDQENTIIDAVVYGDGDISIPGWTGSAVQPYTVYNIFGKEGQILFRKLDHATGLPLPDSDSAFDWAQEKGDAYRGRRVRYPGWDLEAFFFPIRDNQPASLTIAIAPDNAFETLVETINSAQSTLQITTLTFENLAIANALAKAALRGVSIEILLEGNPVGGITNQEKGICQKIESVGGQCYATTR